MWQCMRSSLLYRVVVGRAIKCSQVSSSCQVLGQTLSYYSLLGESHRFIFFMSETSNSREATGPSGTAGPSGTSVTMTRAELQELIDSSVQRALSGRQEPSPESGANGGK